MAGFWDNLVNAVRDATDGGSFTWGRDTGASREPAQSSRPGFQAPQSSRPGFSPAPTPSPVRSGGQPVAARPNEPPPTPAPAMVLSRPGFGPEGYEPPELVERTLTPLEESAPALVEGRERARTAEADEARARRAAYFDRIVGSGRTERAAPLTTEQYSSLTPMQRAAVDFNTELLATRDAPSGERRSLGDRRERVTELLRTRDMDTSQLDEYLQLDRAIGQSIIDKMSSTALTSTATAERGSTFGEAVQDARTQATSTVNQASMAQAMGGAEQQVLGAVFDEMVSAGNRYTTQDVVEGLAQLNQASGTRVTPEQVWRFAGQRLRAADQAQVAEVDFDLPAVTAGMETLDVAEIRKRYGL